MKAGKWTVRLACGTYLPHFTIVATLKADGIEWCPVCRKYRPRQSVAPYEPSKYGKRKPRTPKGAVPQVPTLFDPAADPLPDPPPPF